MMKRIEKDRPCWEYQLIVELLPEEIRKKVNYAKSPMRYEESILRPDDVEFFPIGNFRISSQQ